jgi:hypothetical protein
VYIQGPRKHFKKEGHNPKRARMKKGTFLSKEGHIYILYKKGGGALAPMPSPPVPRPLCSCDTYVSGMVNGLSKVVHFLWVLQFLPTRNVNRLGWDSPLTAAVPADHTELFLFYCQCTAWYFRLCRQRITVPSKRLRCKNWCRTSMYHLISVIS